MVIEIIFTTLFSYVMSTFDTQQPMHPPHTETDAPQKKQKHPVVEIVEFVLIALLIVVPVRMFIAQPFIVSGASMEDTFHNGEYLIVDQVSYRLDDPKRGDVIVFRYPNDPSKFFIKRIIGVPGDTITIEGNTVTLTTVDGETTVLEEPYIKSMEEGSNLTETLSEDEYFVMGDNRDRSSDSRVWGVLEEEKIIGKAFLRLFPFTKVELLPGAYPIIQ